MVVDIGWEGVGGTKPDSTGNGALAEKEFFALKVAYVLGGGRALTDKTFEFL